MPKRGAFKGGRSSWGNQGNRFDGMCNSDVSPFDWQWELCVRGSHFVYCCFLVFRCPFFFPLKWHIVARIKTIFFSLQMNEWNFNFIFLNFCPWIFNLIFMVVVVVGVNWIDQNVNFVLSFNAEHDDRDSRKPTGQDLTIRSGANRRVSFKTTRRDSRPISNANGMKMGIRACYEDDDDMAEILNAQNNRKSCVRRRGSPIPKTIHHRAKQLVESASGWFRVVVSILLTFDNWLNTAMNDWFFVCFQIPHGHKYDKKLLLELMLRAVSPEIFIPHYWKTESTNALFYVDDFKMAKALSCLDRTIDLPNGFKMLIKVHNGIPPVQLDEKLKALMAGAMDKRYNPTTKALNLSKFHSDELLLDVFCPLFRPPLLLAAIDMIAEKVPDLVALSLDNNKLQSLDTLKCLSTKLPQLQILHLADNRVSARHTPFSASIIIIISFFALKFHRSVHREHWRIWNNRISSILCWKEIQFVLVIEMTPSMSGITIIVGNYSYRMFIIIIILTIISHPSVD